MLETTVGAGTPVVVVVVVDGRGQRGARVLHGWFYTHMHTLSRSRSISISVSVSVSVSMSVSVSVSLFSFLYLSPSRVQVTALADSGMLDAGRRAVGLR